MATTRSEARRSASTILAGLLLAVLIGAAPVEARRARPRPADPGRASFFQGMAAFKAGNYPVALSHFIASYKARPKPVVVFNIAMCHRALFNYLQSIAAFEEYRRLRGPRIARKQAAEIRRLLAEMRGKLGHLTFTVGPRGAQVLIDGESVGTAPLAAPVAVNPGIRRVRVLGPGHLPHDQTVQVTDGQRITLAVQLRPVPTAGHVTLTSPVEGAQVRLPDRRLRRLPATVTLPAGRHRLPVTAPGHRATVVELDVRAGQTARREVALEPLPRPRRLVLSRRVAPPPARRAPPDGGSAAVTPPPFFRRAWFWVVVGAAVAAGAAALGGYFGWRASQPDDSFDRTIRLP